MRGEEEGRRGRGGPPAATMSGLWGLKRKVKQSPGASSTCAGCYKNAVWEVAGCYKNAVWEVVDVRAWGGWGPRRTRRGCRILDFGVILVGQKREACVARRRS